MYLQSVALNWKELLLYSDQGLFRQCKLLSGRKAQILSGTPLNCLVILLPLLFAL